MNTTAKDAASKRLKVEVLAEAVGKMGFGTIVESYAKDLAHEEVVHALASCDFLFGCMDSADGRDILNRIATYYQVPYVDIGVRLDADGKGGVEQICCAVHYLLPGGSSLLSRGVVTADLIQGDNALLLLHFELIHHPKCSKTRNTQANASPQKWPILTRNSLAGFARKLTRPRRKKSSFGRCRAPKSAGGGVCRHHHQAGGKLTEDLCAAAVAAGS